MSTTPQSVPIKIIMVGSISVGKTSLVTKFATGKKPIRKESTKAASYVVKYKIVNGTNFELKLWDTAGQEKYKSLTKLFIKDAKIAILVYSIIDEQSFQDLPEWLKIVKSSNDDNLLYGVAANKSDLSSNQIISDEMGKEFAKSIDAEWRSTSAIIEGEGIDSFIDQLFMKYYKMYFTLSNTTSLSITLSSEPSQVQKKGCCGGGNNNNNKTNNNSTGDSKKVHYNKKRNSPNKKK